MIGNKVNGNTSYPNAQGIITITLNSNRKRMGRSQLSFARTMLHEMIHAELIRKVVEAGGYNHLQNFANSYQGDDPFMMIWEYYNTYDKYTSAGNPGWQHEYMADYYVDFIAQGLRVLHFSLSTRGFIDYKTGTTLPFSDNPWVWDDFFTALAWVGLQETEQYQTEVVDEGLEENYNFYVEDTKRESSSNRCN